MIGPSRRSRLRSAQNPFEALNAGLVESVESAAAEVEVVCELSANESTGEPLLTATSQGPLDTPIITKCDECSPVEELNSPAHRQIGDTPAPAPAPELDTDCFVVDSLRPALSSFSIQNVCTLSAFVSAIGSAASEESLAPVQLLVTNADGSPAFTLLPLLGLQLQSPLLTHSDISPNLPPTAAVGTSPRSSSLSQLDTCFSTQSAVTCRAFSFADAPITARRALGAAAVVLSNHLDIRLECPGMTALLSVSSGQIVLSIFGAYAYLQPGRL